MGGAGLTLLTRADLLAINRLQCEEIGGFHDGGDNLGNAGSLDYILDAIQGSVFGVERYPDVIHKAAALGYTIITRHVFKDGNKRTGLQACQLFLALNGYEMRLTPHEEVIDMTLNVAAGQVGEDAFLAWVRARTIPPAFSTPNEQPAP